MRSRSLIRLLPLLLLALGGAREAAAQACLSTQGSNEYCKALTPAVRFGFPRYATAALPTCNTSNKGAVAFDTTAGSYKGCDGSTWAAIGFSGGTITSPILAPAADNCASVPYSFTGDTNTGICSAGAEFVGIVSSGTEGPRWGYGSQYMGTGNDFRWTSAGLGSTVSSMWINDGAGSLWQRNYPGTPSAQQYHWTYSWTDASNYQGGVLKTSSTGIEIAAETAGSGADNLGITLTPAGTGGVLLNGVTTTSSAVYPAVQALTAGGLYTLQTAYLSDTTSAYYWTPAEIVALGASLTGDVTVATLPARTMVTNAMVIITTPAAGTTTLTVACGRAGADYIDYIVASDAKAAANTVYGDASAERGTNLSGYDLPSYTGTTAVKCHFISTGANLDQVTGSVGRVYLTTRLLQ